MKAVFVSSILASSLLLTPVMALPEGYELTPWAEPFDIEYPTALSAAADGTVYVSVDQNASLGKNKKAGKVISCRDTDGDGKADQFIDFVPDVDSPRGGHFVRDTLYLIHPPFLSAFRDTTGDGVADEQKILLENIGFGLRHPRGSDHTTNGCRMGIDGWIYIAVGDFGMEGTKGTDGTVVTLRGGGVARVRPDGTQLEIYSYHTRNICDLAISPRMDLFTRDNTNDGKGWNIRVHHLTHGSEHGYPRLYQKFSDEAVKPMLDLGGGSGTGALYLAEPGHEELMLTCDWTTGKIYNDILTRKGADFTVKERDFLDLPRAVDIDVDGSSNLYVCDWRGGRFKYAGEGVKVGMVQKLTKKGLEMPPFPDLGEMPLADLLEGLKSQSAVRRLETQREILARGGNAASAGLIELIGKAPLVETRIAAIFTLAQLEDSQADELINLYLKDWTEVAESHEFIIRAAAEMNQALSESSLELLVNSLDAEDSRVRLQAIIALAEHAKAGDGLSAKIIKSATEAKDARIYNTAIFALVKIADVEALLSQSKQRLARLALMRLHRADVVSGLITTLEGASGAEALALSEVLARLFFKEEKWDLKSWWGTRPDDRGPYFAPVKWEQSDLIRSAIEGIFEEISEEEREKLLVTLGLNRLPISEFKLGDQDPFALALVAPDLNQIQIQVLTEAAKRAERPWTDRVKAYRALGRVLDGEGVKNQVEILGAWLDQEQNPREVERELGDFVNQPALILSQKKLQKIAAKGSPSESRVAWRALLTFVRSPLIKEGLKTPILKTLEKNPRQVGLYLALSDLLMPGFEQQIENAIQSDNDTLIAAAEHAKKVIAAAKASSGKTLAEFEVKELSTLALQGSGDPENGQKLYTQQGCIACHAVDQKAVQKGPYLGSSGSKFTKDYLIESILEPNAVVAQGFQTELITMNDGGVHMGFVTREEDGIVDVRNIAGIVTQLKAAEVKQRAHQPQSMMPAGLAQTLTLKEFNDLIAYLTSLKE